MRSLLVSSRIANADPQDYEARSNIMWTATWALNTLIAKGKTTDWMVHMLGQSVGAYTNATHGMTLSAVSLAYYRHILAFGLTKFKRFALNVWDVNPEGKSDEEIALEGLKAMEGWMRELGLAMTISELGATEEMIEGIADGTLVLKGGYKVLEREEIVKILKEIEYHTERANDIVDHVRSYAKPHEVKREEHDLRDIVAKTVATFEKSGRTTVPVIVEGERRALVEADDWEIELALLNLLKNSADAFTEIHPAMRDEDEDVIRIRIEDHEETWWIRVIDNAKLVDATFTEQFFQKLETTKAHGLGLGLSIVSSLAERHAGRVWAEPNPGRGVIVTIELPKYQPLEEKI